LFFSEKEYPFCIDLDGTLIKNDVTKDQLTYVLKNKTLKIPFLFLSLLKGKAFFKKCLNVIAKEKAIQFLFNEELVHYLLKQTNTELYLVTGCYIDVAQKASDEIFAHHQIKFKQVLATEKTNLVGKKKANLLRNRFPHGFIYFGNSAQDIQVWKKAVFIGCVNPDKRAMKFLKKNKQKCIYSNVSLA
jgi:hypothetical protein